jgi:hypothetical protein
VTEAPEQTISYMTKIASLAKQTWESGLRSPHPSGCSTRTVVGILRRPFVLWVLETYQAMPQAWHPVGINRRAQIRIGGGVVFVPATAPATNFIQVSLLRLAPSCTPAALTASLNARKSKGWKVRTPALDYHWKL